MHRMIRTSVLLALCCATVVVQAADEHAFLHPLFCNHAVLQRNLSIPVWGWTTPGATVSVSVDGQAAHSGVANAQGRWQVKIGPFPAGGPHTMRVAAPQQQVVLNDLLFGDVWICSGQSNMEFGIGMLSNAAEEIANANYPNMRIYLVPHAVSMTPVDQPGGAWAICTSENIKAGGWSGFSAVGYFFGRELHKELNIPIGLIESSWGGTLAEAWTSSDALLTLDDFKEHVLQNQQYKDEPNAQARLMVEWYQKNDPGTAQGWNAPGFATASWKDMQLPTYWENAGMPNYDGVVWFRREITLSAAAIQQDAMLHLGAIDDRDTTYVNGVQVGAMDFFKDLRNYRVPKALLAVGTNVIAVRVLDTGGYGGIYGPADAMHLDCPGQPALDLTGAWRYQASAELKTMTAMPNIARPGDPAQPTVLYNGMIASLVPYAITGAVWYQGESNVDRSMQYRVLLPTMITDWRKHFAVGDFPFYIVQLANISVIDGSPNESNWSDLREAQAMTAFSLPHCGLASAIDIGDGNNIHPTDKVDVGHRLALNAFAQVYGKSIEYQGPLFASAKIEGATMRVGYTHLGGGLISRDANGTPQRVLRGFAIAGADRHFEWADAHIDGDSVVVSSTKVPAPVWLRFAWGSNPQFTLYNKAGLPGVPFRTDSPQ